MNGLCVDLCEGVECAAGEYCVDGACHGEDDCYEAGCPPGQLCLEGGCADDPCADMECSPESFYRQGQCVFSCADVACLFGEVCVDGQCEDDTCDGRFNPR